MKILIAGDFCPYGRVKDALNNHSFNALFSDVKEVIYKSSDYSIVNLECPILKTPSKSISKVGPALYTTPDAIDALNIWVSIALPWQIIISMIMEKLV